MADPGNQFDASRAELFEALGHPMRVKILQVLEGRPMGFAELKREVGIESSGHLQFHLAKLSGLVGTTAGGDYALTDDGREAIRVLRSAKTGHEETAPFARASSLRRIGWRTALIAVLLVALVVLASFAIYQQDQIAAMNRNLSSDTVSIAGTRYYHVSIPLQPNGARVLFHGVTFTILQPDFINYSNPNDFTYAGSVRLTNGTLLNLNGKTVMVEMTGLGLTVQVKTGQTFAGNGSLTLTGPGAGNWSFMVTQPHYFTIIPSVGMSFTFPDGSQVTHTGFNVTARWQHAYNLITHPVVVLTVTTLPAIVNPWFTQHAGLRAGLSLNITNSAYPLTLYVSAPT
jgi:DNA-binding HxlR family transcriptional regulator